jgi:hypothetical protein
MNLWQEIQFGLRDKYLGRARIRWDAPNVTVSAAPEHAFYELALRRAFSADELRSADLIVDVGSSNGSYLQALAHACPRARIVGVEVDGGRRYWNGFRRVDMGNAYAKGLRDQGRDVEYLWGDFRDLSANTLNIPTQGTVLSTFFYPFVSTDPCISWGLPARYANFNSLLHAWLRLARVAPETQFYVMSIHQGEWERDLARSTYKSEDLDYSEDRINRAEFAGFWPSEHDAFVFRVTLKR